MSADSSISRRNFLLQASGAMGGFFIGSRFALAGGIFSRNTNTDPGGWITAWVGVGSDGRFWLRFSKAEMGQGILTTLLAIVGEELNTDPREIRFQAAPLTKEFGNPKFLGESLTGGTTSILTSYDPLRKAAAALKTVMVKAGARKLKTSEAQCELQNAQVVSRSGAKVALKLLVSTAGQMDIPDHPVLKDKKNYQFLGKSQKRIDLMAKITGQARYGIDVELSGPREIVVAVVLRCPQKGGRLLNKEKYLIQDGYVALKGGVAVFAPTYWQALQKLRALQASDQLRPEWDLSLAKKPDTEALKIRIS